MQGCITGSVLVSKGGFFGMGLASRWNHLPVLRIALICESAREIWSKCYRPTVNDSNIDNRHHHYLLLLCLPRLP
jgi:hypothetical protein